jgi:hypothetical protein
MGIYPQILESLGCNLTKEFQLLVRFLATLGTAARVYSPVPLWSFL